MGGYIPWIPGVYKPDPGSRITDLILRRGDIAAERQAQQGQIWGNALANVGQNIGQTIAQEPMRKLELSRARHQETLANLEEEKLKRETADRAALDAMPAGADLATIEAQAPGHLRGQLREAWYKQEELKAKWEKSSTEAAAAQADMLGNGARYLKNHLTDQDGGISAAATWVQTLPPHLQRAAQPYMQQIQQNPKALPQILETLIGQSPAEQTRLAKEQNEEYTLKQGDIRIRGGKTIAENPKESKVGTEEDFIRKRFGPNPTDAQVLQGRAQWAAAGREPDVAPNFTPEGKKLAADLFKQTGVMIPLGMGKAGTRAREEIVNEAAREPGVDIAANKANYAANSGSLKKLQQQTDAVTAFEATAKKNAAILDNIIGKLPDAGARFLNRPIRAAAAELGSEDAAEFETILRSVQNEYGRITSNPNLTGVLSDSARKEAESLIAKGGTVGAMRRQLAVLSREAENRRTSFEGQLGTIRGRMSSKPAVAPSGLKPDEDALLKKYGY